MIGFPAVEGNGDGRLAPKAEAREVEVKAEEVVVEDGEALHRIDDLFVLAGGNGLQLVVEEKDVEEAGRIGRQVVLKGRDDAVERQHRHPELHGIPVSEVSPSAF